MGRSSITGIDRAAAEPAGRDTATLGPGDSSDSGSDVAGTEAMDHDDPTLPLDVALSEDGQRTFLPVHELDSAPSDASGTGERASAVSDGGMREAADISVDRVFDPEEDGDALIDEDAEDPALAFLDRAESGAVLDEEAGAGEDDVATLEAIEDGEIDIDAVDAADDEAEDEGDTPATGTVR